eukprot:jgi/Orpsp1_1/1177800/evm.model.c7180000062906.1
MKYWITQNPNLFILIFVVIDLLIFGLMCIQPYKIQTIIVNNDKNFQKCKIGGYFSWLLLIIISLFKFIIFWNSLALLLLEWNIKSIYYDVRFSSSICFIDNLIFIIIIIFDLINIKNYKLYFITRELLIILIIVSNVTLYSSRIILFNMNKYYVDDHYYENCNQSSIDTTPSSFREFSNSADLMSSSNNNIDNNDDGNINRNFSYKKYLSIIRYNKSINSNIESQISMKSQSSRYYRNSFTASRSYKTNFQSSIISGDRITIKNINNNEMKFQDDIKEDIENEISSINSLTNEEDISQLRNVII